ncbi:MAG: hypothetical protein KDC12_13260, partial [Flavobacteriales bacterium]|nr:hypothetical protein [Flavobacteriales bacterium]
SKTIEQKDASNSYFLPEQRENILEMLRLVEKAFEEMNNNLTAEWGKVNLEKAKSCESAINNMRNALRSEHLGKVEQGEYSFKTGMIYSDLFGLCEKAGDHIINVSEAMAGKY